MYYFGARYYDPRISFFISVDPLAEQTMEPYLYTGNNPIMFTDPTGMSKEGREDWIDIDKNTGSLRITPNKEKDVVRLVNNGNVESSYLYGENGSFRADTKIETNGLDESTEMRIKFKDANKAWRFYRMAAKSDKEFAYVDINYGNDKGRETTVLTNGGRSFVKGSNYAHKVLEENQSARLLYISHSHPGTYRADYGHVPAVPSGFNDDLSQNNDTGVRQGYIRGNKFDGRRPKFYNIYIPSKPSIQLKYNGQKAIRKL